MRSEVLVFRRCCICVPLRYGLIAWGYFRLLLSGLVLFAVSLNLDMTSSRHETPTSFLVFIVIAIILVIVDIILGIVFIVGCHKKNALLMKKYYRYNQFLMSLLIPLCIYIFGMYLYQMIKYKVPFIPLIWSAVLDSFGIFSYVVIQIYVMLLVKSEIIKLDNDCQFRFENNVTQAECSVKIGSSSGGNVTENNVNKIDDDEDIRNYV